MGIRHATFAVERYGALRSVGSVGSARLALLLRVQAQNRFLMTVPDKIGTSFISHLRLSTYNSVQLLS